MVFSPFPLSTGIDEVSIKYNSFNLSINKKNDKRPHSMENKPGF